jgi:zinc protease
MFLVHKPNFTGKELTQQVQEVIDRIAEDGVPESELRRAQTFLRAARINELQSAMNRAQKLGKYEVLDGDASLINSELDRFLTVTSDQIQTFAKKFLTPDKRATLEVVPEPSGPGGPSASTQREVK